MPIRGVILILVLAVLFALIFRNQIYESIKPLLHEDEDKDEEKDIIEEIVEE